MKQPIGIFDSGVGGLTVLKELLTVLPHERFVYFGDTARVPYGGKSPETIKRFSIENTIFLNSLDVKGIVVACHTASSLTLDALRNRFKEPLTGVVEPGVKKALECTSGGRIGVIGTRSTIQSHAHQNAVTKRDSKVKTFNQACPLLVSLVEEGWIEGEVTQQILKHYLEPLKANHVDTLILGCTHYPMLAASIQKVMTDKVRLIDPAVETAMEVAQSFEVTGPDSQDASQVTFYVTDEPQRFREVGQRFLNFPLGEVHHVEDYYPAPATSRTE
jgi:glutamate racemase